MPQHNHHHFVKPKKPMEAPGAVIKKGGESVVVVTGPIRGGYVQNPSIGPGSLFLDMVNTPKHCAEGAHCTTIELSPGERFTIPPLQADVQVKANSETAGHRFTAVIW
jgi:hypothetical protein